LANAYEKFGWLRANKFAPIKKQTVKITVKCDHCKKPLKKIVKGVEINGDLPQIPNTLTLYQKARQLGINTLGIPLSEIAKKISTCVYKNSNLKIRISPKDLVLGEEVVYFQVVKEYRIKNIQQLKADIKNNKRAYLHDKKERKKPPPLNSQNNTNVKEGNDYG
jgi:hypothetical protein